MKILVNIINLLGIGAIDESFEFYEDWDLLMRIAQKNFLPYQKNIARYNQWSKGQQINQQNADYMRAMHLQGDRKTP